MIGRSPLEYGYRWFIHLAGYNSRLDSMVVVESKELVLIPGLVLSKSRNLSKPWPSHLQNKEKTCTAYRTIGVL